MTILTSTGAAPTLSSASLLYHARSLRDTGFTVLTDIGIDQALVRQVWQGCQEEHAELLGATEKLGIDGVEQFYNFNEICHRSRSRWDFRVKHVDGWRTLIRGGVAAAAPIIEELHRLAMHPGEEGFAFTRRLTPTRPATIMSGVILSRPDADAQKFHADASNTHLTLASMLPSHRLFKCEHHSSNRNLLPRIVLRKRMRE